MCIFLVSLSICEFACGCVSLCVSGQLFVNVCVCVYVSVWTFLYETTVCSYLLECVHMHAFLCQNGCVCLCLQVCVSECVCVS